MKNQIKNLLLTNEIDVVIDYIKIKAVLLIMDIGI